MDWKMRAFHEWVIEVTFPVIAELSLYQYFNTSCLAADALC